MKMIMIMNMGILINTMEKKKNGGDQLITRMAQGTLELSYLILLAIRKAA